MDRQLSIVAIECQDKVQMIFMYLAQLGVTLNLTPASNNPRQHRQWRLIRDAGLASLQSMAEEVLWLWNNTDDLSIRLQHLITSSQNVITVFGTHAIINPGRVPGNVASIAQLPPKRTLANPAVFRLHVHDLHLTTQALHTQLVLLCNIMPGEEGSLSSLKAIHVAGKTLSEFLAGVRNIAMDFRGYYAYVMEKLADPIPVPVPIHHPTAPAVPNRNWPAGTRPANGQYSNRGRHVPHCYRK